MQSCTAFSGYASVCLQRNRYWKNFSVEGHVTVTLGEEGEKRSFIEQKKLEKRNIDSLRTVCLARDTEVTILGFFYYQITLKQSSSFLELPSFLICSYFVLPTKDLLNSANSQCISIWFVTQLSLTLLLAAAWHYTDTFLTVR